MALKSMKDFLADVPAETQKLVSNQLQIASRIGEMLRKRGWKQRELCLRTGLKPSYISKVLSGEANMTLETISKLEVAFGEDIITVQSKDKERVASIEISINRYK